MMNSMAWITVSVLGAGGLSAEFAGERLEPIGQWVAQVPVEPSEPGLASPELAISSLAIHRLPPGGGCELGQVLVLPGVKPEDPVRWAVSVGARGSLEERKRLGGSYVGVWDLGGRERWMHRLSPETVAMYSMESASLEGTNHIYVGYRELEPFEERIGWGQTSCILVLDASTGEPQGRKRRGREHWPDEFGDVILGGRSGDRELLFIGRGHKSGQKVEGGVGHIEVFDGTDEPVRVLRCPLGDDWKLPIMSVDACILAGDVDERGCSDILTWARQLDRRRGSVKRTGKSALLCISGEDGALLGKADLDHAQFYWAPRIVRCSDMNGDEILDLRVMQRDPLRLVSLSGADLKILGESPLNASLLPEGEEFVRHASCLNPDNPSSSCLAILSKDRNDARTLSFYRGAELEPVGILSCDPIDGYLLKDIRSVADADGDGFEDLALEYWILVGSLAEPRFDVLVTLLGTRSLGL